MSTPQSAASHTRWVPAFHFFVLPILLINALVAISTLIKAPSTGTAWGALVGLALFGAAFFSRIMPLSAQDRLIRLEETLRMQRVLPATQHGDIAKLTRFQFVALRFASDAELAELVGRTVKGEFAKPLDIKKAIRGWRPDELRV